MSATQTGIQLQPWVCCQWDGNSVLTLVESMSRALQCDMQLLLSSGLYSMSIPVIYEQPSYTDCNCIYSVSEWTRIPLSFILHKPNKRNRHYPSISLHKLRKTTKIEVWTISGLAKIWNWNLGNTNQKWLSATLNKEATHLKHAETVCSFIYLIFSKLNSFKVLDSRMNAHKPKKNMKGSCNSLFQGAIPAPAWNNGQKP